MCISQLPAFISVSDVFLFKPQHSSCWVEICGRLTVSPPSSGQKLYRGKPPQTLHQGSFIRFCSHGENTIWASHQKKKRGGEPHLAKILK